MKVPLCAGPKGGEIVDWADDAKDGDVATFDGCHYRIDFGVGQALFVGMDPPPRPTVFRSALDAVPAEPVKEVP
jgi:hypothetical protein